MCGRHLSGAHNTRFRTGDAKGVGPRPQWRPINFAPDFEGQVVRQLKLRGPSLGSVLARGKWGKSTRVNIANPE